MRGPRVAVAAAVLAAAVRIHATVERYIGTRVRRDDRPGRIAQVERRHTARRRGVVGSTRLVRLGLDVQHFKASGRIPRRAAPVARHRATLATGNWRGPFRHHQRRLWHPDATSPAFSMSAMANNGNPGSVCMGPDSATKMEYLKEQKRALRTAAYPITALTPAMKFFLHNLTYTTLVRVEVDPTGRAVDDALQLRARANKRV